jgi:hypothetical protein
MVKLRGPCWCQAIILFLFGIAAAAGKERHYICFGTFHYFGTFLCFTCSDR